MIPMTTWTPKMTSVSAANSLQYTATRSGCRQCRRRHDPARYSQLNVPRQVLCEHEQQEHEQAERVVHARRTLQRRKRDRDRLHARSDHTTQSAHVTEARSTGTEGTGHTFCVFFSA
jgi:hypothetical protein